MKTTVTREGPTAVPAAVWQRQGFKPGDQLAWLDDGTTIKGLPLPPDPVRALLGRGRGQRRRAGLLASRRRDEEHE